MATTELLGEPQRVRTDELAVANTDLVKMAYSRSQRMSGKTYGRSGIDANIVGAFGEFATLTWMTAQGLDPEALFERELDHGDIRTASGMLTEVKTSRSDWWKREGAVVTASQLSTLSRYNVLVWCVTGITLRSSPG